MIWLDDTLQSTTAADARLIDLPTCHPPFPQISGLAIWLGDVADQTFGDVEEQNQNVTVYEDLQCQRDADMAPDRLVR